MATERDGTSRPESFRADSKIDALRVPPQSVESEQAVIGGLMLVPDCLEAVKLKLTEEDFYRRDHRLIFLAMCTLAKKGKPLDAVTLGEWLEANMIADQIGGTGYLIELASTTPSAANIQAYADIVAQKSLLRRTIELGTEIVNAGFRPEGKDAAEVLSGVQGTLTTLATLANANTARLLAPADLRAIAGTKVEPPAFVMAPYFPRRVVTLLGGHGGAGKSTLALLLAAHVAAGRWWAGHRVEKGRVTLFTFEDDARTVGYRLQHIVEQYNLDAEAVYANLQVFDWSEGDTALAVEKAEFGIHTLESTALFDRLKVAARGSDLVLIDNASDTFDGNENNKRQVRAFMGMLKTGIAQPNDSAVVLLAHIDKNAARYGAAGNSFSGSVAWHNSARSRLALVDSKDDGLELRHEKANFGAKAEAMPLTMADFGVLIPCAAGQGASTTNEGQDAAGVLAAIRAAAAAGTPVGNGRMGPGNAHQVLATFAALPARLKQAKGKDAFWLALDSLVSSGRVLVEERYGSGRNMRRFLIEAGTQSSLFITPHTPLRGTDETHEAGSSSCVGSDEGSELTKPTKPTKEGRDYRSAQSGEE